MLLFPVYIHIFFDFINSAAVAAKNSFGSDRPHLILTSFADVDVIAFRLGSFSSSLSSIDAAGMQIYRGKDFGVGDQDILAALQQHYSKPILVLEYGIDAYNDPCGKAETSVTLYTDQPDHPYWHVPPTTRDLIAHSCHVRCSCFAIIADGAH